MQIPYQTTLGGGRVLSEELLKINDIACMSPDYFEIFCTILWGKQGYNVYRTPRTRDGGIDIVAIRDNSGLLIQCKTSSRAAGKELGWEAVKDVVAGAAAYAARHPGITFKKIATTNQKFNDTARSQAKINHVELVDQSILQRMLSEKPVLRREVEAVCMKQQ